MHVFREFTGDGPYIVSTLDPLNPTNPSAPDRTYVPQDLSWPPVQFVELWMQAFFDSLNSSAWEYNSLRLHALKLRAYLTIGGEGLDQVEAAAKRLGGVAKAMKSSIGFVEPTEKHSK